MELRAAGLKEQPFCSKRRPAAFFGYAGEEKATEFFRSVQDHNTGLGLFQGPPDSGKSTIIRHFAESQTEQSAVAIVNGEGLNATALLESILRSFGYQHKFDSLNELLNMVTVFIKQQTAGGTPPMLFIENTHAMNPNAMHLLCELASVRVREKYALRMVLVSDRTIDYIPRAPAMECMAKRLTGDFHLNPLTIDETSDYLYAKMRQGGCVDPDFVFPDEVCEELYRASGGWPGILDRLAMLALEQAEHCPVGVEHVEHPSVPKSTRPDYSDPAEGTASGAVRKGPLLFLTRNGETLRKVRFNGTRLIVGRAEHNDLCVDSQFISRHHALLVRHGNSTLLMDLNSANGTFVNSRRISNQVLAHDDVITLGDYELKFVDPGARPGKGIEGISLDDTVIMMTLEDMHNVLVRENTAILPVKPEVGGSPGEAAR